jgi:hypothetical protein
MPVIPKIFHRTVRTPGLEPYEGYWRKFQEMHPDWEFVTYTGGGILHRKEPERESEDFSTNPMCFGVHHWATSWRGQPRGI